MISSDCMRSIELIELLDYSLRTGN
jgi:hypothetical protein